MKCFITGASGFIGSHLVEPLLMQGATVYALDRQPARFSGSLSGDLHFIECDILDRDSLFRSISTTRPDCVFHLAAQSLPKTSWEDPETTFRINVFGTLNLLDAIRAADISPIIEILCSSGEYAPSQDGTPIHEEHSLEPSSPYALSKIAEDHVSALYFKAYQMRILRVRPFFIIGPRKVGDVCSDLCRGIVAIERGQSTQLRVGNLDAVRDFLDVQDAVAALILIALRGIPGKVYNISSGVGHSIGDMLAELRRLSRVPIEVVPDPTLLRPLDEAVKIGDNSRLQDLGWRPSVHIRDSLSLILEYWRSENGQASA
jgi:GDP-4-dehydro-6-deoxy-D-mannose reductase